MADLTLDQMYPILRYFEFEHLAQPQREVAGHFYNIAYMFADLMAYCPETSAGLRKLLEAKDCFVRASLEGR